MEDIHFLSRLARVSPTEETLALSLYRDTALVSHLLKSVSLPEGAERVAVSLGDNARGPFVIVNRAGRFITCLGEGMSIGELPLINKQKLDSACARVEGLRQRLEAARRLVGPDGMERLMVRVIKAGTELSREEFIAVSAWQPMLAPRFFGKMLDVAYKLEEVRAQLSKVAPGRAAHRKSLRAYWCLMWSLGHLAVLASMGGVQPWMESFFAEREDRWSLFSLPSVRQGVTALALRGSWTVGRLGKVALPLYKRLYAEADDKISCFHSGMGLLVLGFRHSRLEAEVRKSLVGRGSGAPAIEDVPEEASAKQIAAPLMGKLINEPELCLNAHRNMGRNMCVRLGKRAPKDSPYRFERPEDVPDELAFCVPVSGVGNYVEDMGILSCMLTMVPWVARAKAEDLFLPDDYLRATYEPWEPKDTTDLLSFWKPLYKSQPVQVEKKPGRNEACPCGSGQKYKRCCGG